MRKTLFTHGQIYNLDQVKELNTKIRENFIKTAQDRPAEDAVKTSEVKFLKLGSIGNLINPFIQFCYSANVNAFGFDLFSLNSDKTLNYNIYQKIQSIIGILTENPTIQLEILNLLVF